MDQLIVGETQANRARYETTHCLYHSGANLIMKAKFFSTTKIQMGIGYS